MFKEIYNLDTVALLGKLGLVIFFVTFLAIVVWALTRPKRDVKRWSKLPLNDSDPK